MAADIVAIVQGRANLLEVVRALHARCCLTDLLHGRQQQANQDGNDRDDDQQLDERKAATNVSHSHRASRV
jgi:hypothetical protein